MRRRGTSKKIEVEVDELADWYDHGRISMSTKVRSRPADAIERLASELGPVPFEGLTEHLIRQMRGWVLRGLIQPGERLPPERKLAAMLNVSRSSLRQALKVLQVMGVFEVKQG